MSDVQDLGSLNDCWVTQPNGKRAMAVNSGGEALNVSAVSTFELAVSQGKIEGYSTIDKFGANPVVDTGTVPEEVWDGGGAYTYDAINTAPIVSLISDDPSDIEPIEITGLDINGNQVVQTLALNGSTRVPLTTPLWRVYRMANVGTSDLAGSVYCYVGTGGVPTIANTRAIIDNGNNQTLMALYTVPLGKVGFLWRGEIGGSRSQNAGAVQGAYYSRRVGKIFRIKKRVETTNQGSTYYQDKRSFPDIIPALTDIKITIENVSASNTGIFATFDILLVDEDQFSPEYLAAIGQPLEMPA